MVSMTKDELEVFVIILRILIKGSHLLPHNARLICSSINVSLRTLPQRMGIHCMKDLNEMIGLDLDSKLRVSHLMLHEKGDLSGSFSEIDSSSFKNLRSLIRLDLYIDTRLTFFPQNITHLNLGNDCIFPLDNLPSNLTHLELGMKFNLPLDNLPSSLTHLTLSSDYDKPLDHLPPNLTHLDTGFHFNEPLDNLPFSLLSLKTSYMFVHSIENLPSGLTHLELGHRFNQPIDHLPSGLTHLILGEDFNQEINNLPNLSYLKVGTLFNQSIEHIPKTITHLILGRWFRQPIDNSTLTNGSEIKSFLPPNLLHLELGVNNVLPIAILPSTLKELHFSHEYDNSIDHLIPHLFNLEVMHLGGFFNRTIAFQDFLPKLLELKFGFSFNKAIDIWPRTLTKLEFGSNFNQPINALPLNLKKLVLGSNFDQPIHFLKELQNLTYLCFGDLNKSQPASNFNQRLSSPPYVLGQKKRTKLNPTSYLPSKLKYLFLGDRFNKSIDVLSELPDLVMLSFGKKFNKPSGSLRNLTKLTDLTFGEDFDKAIEDLPDSIKNLTLEVKVLSKVINLPKSLENLKIAAYTLSAPQLNSYILNRKDFAIESWHYNRNKI